MKHIGLSALLWLAALACNFEINLGGSEKVVYDDPGPEEERGEALVFAQEFLGRLDGGQDVTSILAANVRQSMPEPMLEPAFAGFRSWTGAIKNREILGYGYTESLPDAPPGRYFVIQFRSTFENGTVEEKVVVSYDPAGQRVAGYFQTKRTKL